MYFNINITKHVFEMNLKMIKPTLLLFYMDSTYYWSIGFWDDTCVFGFTSNIFRSFERPVYRFCRSNSGAQKTLDVAINASNYLEMARKTKIQTGGKNNETRRDRNERKNCLRKCFHSSKYLIDHANGRFFFFFLHCFMWFLLYYLLHLLRLLSSSDKFIAIQVYVKTIWINEFSKNHPRGGVFRNVNLKNFGKSLTRKSKNRQSWEVHF